MNQSWDDSGQCSVLSAFQLGSLSPHMRLQRVKGLLIRCKGLPARRFDDAMPFQSVVSAALIIFSVLFRIWGLENSG
jgi:hypothetical protein